MESFENATVLNGSVPFETTGRPDAAMGHANFYLYFFCLAFVLFPGFVTNIVALGFIIKDVHKAVFPAIVLLLALCADDLAAVIFTTIQLSMTMYVKDVTYAICAVLSVTNTFFRLYSGILNVLMCTDRVLALCAPYFYKSHIHVATWKLGTLVAALCTAMFAMFPVIGLGDVVQTTIVNGKETLACSTFYYREEVRKKVYGVLYGLLGLFITFFIIVGNSLVIRAVFKMRKKVVALNTEPTSSTDSDSANKANSTSFEIAFAKLMGGLAIVYLISGAPYSILIVLQQINRVSPTVKGFVYFTAGMSYSVDPIVYILIRKTTRKKISSLLRCRCRDNDFSN